LTIIENRLEQQELSSGASRNAGSEWGGTDGSPNKSALIYGWYGFGLVPGFAYTAPYEDITLKAA